MYRLTTSIPYLLNRAGVRVGALFSRRLERDDLSLGMYRVMACLVEAPGQRLGDLAETLLIENSTMSRLVSTLVAKKLVTRRRLPDNERAVSIDLTQPGRELALTLIQEAKHFEDVMISNFKPGEAEVLKALLDVIYHSSDTLERELSDPHGS